MDFSKTYPVVEKFLSVQGEGFFSGSRAYFIRLAGCNIHCKWCDTKNSWDTSKANLESAEYLAESAKKSGAEFAVITGGEPCMYELSELFASLKERGIRVHLETSGTLPLSFESQQYCDWIAISPKLFAEPLAEIMQFADELKFIVSEKSEILEYLKYYEMAGNAKYVWLHPEWSKSNDSDLLQSISGFVSERGEPFRLGWQLHKLFNVR